MKGQSLSASSICRCEPSGRDRKWTDAFGQKRPRQSLQPNQPEAISADGRARRTKCSRHDIRCVSTLTPPPGVPRWDGDILVSEEGLPKQPQETRNAVAGERSRTRTVMVWVLASGKIYLCFKQVALGKPVS